MFYGFFRVVYYDIKCCLCQDNFIFFHFSSQVFDICRVCMSDKENRLATRSKISQKFPSVHILLLRTSANKEKQETKMPTFTNQAQLTYNGTTIHSNIAVGTILNVLSITKNAVSNVYGSDSEITYVINLNNAGTTPITDITLTDNLGAYTSGAMTLYPLTFLENALLMFVNGVEVPPPTVSLTTTSLVLEDISVPAGGNTTIVYTVRTNSFTPLGEGASVTNTAVATAPGLANSVSAEETVIFSDEALLDITKTIAPVPVAENGIVTYTLTVQNFGSVPVTEDANAVISDTFDPILSDLSVTFNSEEWTEGEEYTYNEQSGLFQSVEGEVTVPAATYTQDPATGEWNVTPGVSVLTIQGRI